MSEPLFPKSVDPLAAGYVLGDLDREETEIFEQRLATEPELAQEVSRLRGVLEEVLYGLNEVKPPQQLRSTILQSVPSSTQAPIPLSPTLPRLGQSATAKQPTSRRRPLPWNKIMGSIAALFMVAIGIDNYQLRQELSRTQEVSTLLQQSEIRLFSLQGMETAKQAQGSFVLNLEQQKGVLAVQNLPAPPAGKVYRLWAVVDGDKIPCGRLSVNHQGTVLEKFSMPADFYEAGISSLIVTLEPSDSARQPVGPTIMASRV
jgi:anti-sigma-K factor RskA